MTHTQHEVRVAIAAALDSVTGLVGYPYPPANPVMPCAFVQVCDADPEQTFGDGDLTEYTVEIAVLVAIAPMDLAQAAVSGYLSPTGSTSIRMALNTDPTLGGVVHSLDVGRNHSQGPMEYVGYEFNGGLIPLITWAT